MQNSKREKLEEA